MRMSEPRIPPLGPDDRDDDATALLAPFVEQNRAYNVFTTMAQHPELARRWMTFANHILGPSSTLPERERELLILRIGHLCRSGYEWAQHARIAKEIGMTDDEIATAASGSQTPGLGDVDRLLLAAAEELHADAHISDDTWAGLSDHFDQRQMMDIVFTVGQYNLVSMALNSFGVQLDDGLEPGHI